MEIKEPEKPNLYLVILGGRTCQSNIEIHDARWVCGDKIEDTFSQLTSQWLGLKNGLHIDSYLKICYIDGYEIILNKESKSLRSNKKLWFVNLGGYSPKELYEFHKITLVVASSSGSAKKKALNRWRNKLELIHKDDLSQIESCCLVDNCIPIQKVNEWHITVRPDSKNRNQKIEPDWYGYLKIK